MKKDENDTFDDNDVFIHLDKLHGRSRYAQVIWFTLILFTIAGFSYHFGALITVYISYPLATSFTDNAVPFEYPDITFCHPLPMIKMKHNPLIARQPNFGSTNLRYYEDFYAKNLHEFWRITLFNNVSETDLTPIQSELRGEAIEASFLNYSARHSFLPTPEDVVVLCMYNNLICNMVNFTVLISRSAGYCFRFQIFDESWFKPGSGNGFLIHLFMENWKPGAKTGQVLAGDDGMKSFVHSRDSWPKLNVPEDVVQISHRLYFILKLWQRQRITTPVKVCKKPEYLRRCYLSRGSNLKCEDFLNDEEFCIHDIYQRGLFSACGCIAHDWLIPSDLVNAQSCYEVPDIVIENRGLLRTTDGNDILVHLVESNDSVSLNNFVDINEVRQKFTCYANYLKDNKHKLKDQCIPLCKENTYEVVNYRIKHDSIHEPQLDKFMVTVLREYLQEINTADLDNSTLANHLRTSDQSGNLISMNSLLYDLSGSLDVFPEGNYGSLEEEYLLYPIEDLFSDIGATLGLWLGCCVITLFELMELLHSVLGYMHRKKGNNAANINIITS